MTDVGLFGPDSVTWRIHSDPSMLLGGLRALYLQALHPSAMAGVSDHSGFREDPWGRFMRTVNYVTTVAFGTTADAKRVGARVRGVHRGLDGMDERGNYYRVEDPHLLRWVHCCEVDSFLTAYQRAGGRLSTTDADRYFDEQARSAELVGLRADEVPRSTEEMRDYFMVMRPELWLSRSAREAARVVLAPPLPTIAKPLRPAWTGIAVAAFGLLPPWARRLYRMPGLPTTDLAATAFATTARRSLLLIPASVREAPPVREARARAASQPPSAAKRAAAAWSVSSRLGNAKRILSAPFDASA